MNKKLNAIFIPIIIFMVTVIVGSFIVFYSLNLDVSQGSKETSETETKELVMGVQTEDAMEISIGDKINSSNAVPVCESFKNITEMSSEDSGKYLKEMFFSFEVLGYEPDIQDSIESVKYSIIDSKTNSSIMDYECKVEESEKVFEDGSNCVATLITDKTEAAVSKYRSVLSDFKFPVAGDYFVKAIVVSTDGTFTKCAVSKDNE